MATFQSEISPLPIPPGVQVRVGKQWVEVPIEELSEQQLSDLAEEFTQRLFEMAGKSL